MMRARRAFTLIEVIAAISLMAVVTAIAAAAIAAASDAGAVVQRHEETLDAESRWRVLVTDMLRHAPAAEAVSEPLLRITRDARAEDGAPQLTFLSRGVIQPFGTGRIWRVRIWSDGAGTHLRADATGHGPDQLPLHTLLPHRSGFDVRVMEAPPGAIGEAATPAASGGAEWRSDWPLERSRPALLQIVFGQTPGERAAAPFIVNLAPVAPATLVSAP